MSPEKYAALARKVSTISSARNTRRDGTEKAKANITNAKPKTSSKQLGFYLCIVLASQDVTHTLGDNFE